MKKIALTFTALSLIVFVSCGGGDKKADKKKEETKGEAVNAKDAPGAAAESCTYSYDTSGTSTTIKWIAYKFTSKTPVEGKFEKVVVSQTHPGPSPVDVLQGAEFHVIVGSLQTGDEAKNKNIIDGFFANTTSQSAVDIWGTVTEITETSVTINLNFIVEKEITLECKWEGEKVTATGTISLEEFEGMSAIEKLNKQCKKNHTGEDGVTKVWPEVTLMVETTLKKECAE